MVRLVVTDMDNTLYSWVDYIVPAVEAMVAAVCAATGFPRIRVVQSLKSVYSTYESNEYPYALQESSIYAEFPDFGSFDKLVIDPARAAFAQARKKYLRPFRAVVETLETLKSRGIPVVALTDAPRNPAEYRAKFMGLDQYLEGLYTLPGFRFPKRKGEALVAPHILSKDERGEYRAACPVVELPRSAEKPSTLGLSKICKDHGVTPREVLIVGDSLHKDLALAHSVGAVGVWAEYGTYVSHEYRERLDIISAAAITRRHAASLLEAGARAETKPEHTLSNFGQLLEVLEKVGVSERARPRKTAFTVASSIKSARPRRVDGR
jgi:FMN phosphatase YigB (HAD superfamily)